MITSPAFSGKRYGVFGLARSGLASVAALRASGAEVLAWDDGPAAFEGPLTDLNTADLAGLAAIVVSPGVPHSAPIFARAKAAGVPMIGDIELFAQARADMPAHRIIGITGTNGKSTTTALIHHILKSAGRSAEMGGNIGLPILAQDPLPAGGIWVLELSSYQLDITETLACEVALLLNITPDHLERHGSMAAYAAAKQRLFAMQTAEGAAITDRASASAWAMPGGPAQTVIISDDVALSGQADWPALQGPHNFANARAAVAVVRALGIREAEITQGLRSYAGLPHRMERIGSKGGVLYVNDSKATNPDSTAPALAAFPATHWIAGGKAKGEDLDALTPYLADVRAAYLIGEAAPLFRRLLAGRLLTHQCGTLDRAVSEAAKAARPGETVLFSPACASFDQFRDFEARGDAFRAAVEALA